MSRPAVRSCFGREVRSMALEALKRNGHNLHIGAFMEEGKYGIPRLSPVLLPERLDWLPFNCARTDKNRDAHGVHFFMDDYLFERVWNDPARYALLLSDFRAVMTPDFSLFTDYPLPVQLYNHWRKHQLGAYWQGRGLTVIPSVCWSDEASYDWCFDGEPAGGTVAVSSVGTQKNPKARQLFLAGYQEMTARLKPAKVIFFGDVPEGCTGNIERHSAYHAALPHARRR